MTEQSWFWVGLAGMALGGLALLVYGRKRTQDEEGHTIIHVVVPIVAACAYFAMARGQGGRVMGDGHVFFYARYVDWSITTPLLLLGLCMTALHGAHRRPGLVAAVLGADVVMIATGLFSGLSSDPTDRWTWFVISTGAFLAVYAALFGPLLKEAKTRDAERRASYGANALVLAVLWLLYPVIVLLGPDGTGVWSATTNTACITLLDLVSKIGYGFLTTATTKKVASADRPRVRCRRRWSRPTAYPARPARPRPRPDVEGAAGERPQLRSPVRKSRNHSPLRLTVRSWVS